MRLTPELIAQAPCYLNAVKDRELDLRSINFVSLCSGHSVSWSGAGYFHPEPSVEFYLGFRLPIFLPLFELDLNTPVVCTETTIQYEVYIILDSVICYCTLPYYCFFRPQDPCYRESRSNKGMPGALSRVLNKLYIV